MIDPALGALGVADAAPILEFGSDLDGNPGLVKTQATSWSLVGPPRTFTRSVFRLT